MIFQKRLGFGIQSGAENAWNQEHQENSGGGLQVGSIEDFNLISNLGKINLPEKRDFKSIAGSDTKIMTS